MTKKRKARRTGVSLIRAFFLLLAAAVLSFSQAQSPVIGQPGSNTTRSVMGTVIDSHGAPVPRAVVLLKDMKTLQIRSYIAQDDGSYHFYDLSGDINYQLRAQSNGLTSSEKTVSVFNSHKIVKLNLKLNKKLKT
ncbi:MAG TPA: carboxypeptidase-like regulatory domain-containing protein [Bryobacteraceae bacterium]|nr:carboxypeptidase-like regulatory domain-containing protein [Bryobacteraceae bacterium]